MSTTTLALPTKETKGEAKLRLRALAIWLSVITALGLLSALHIPIQLILLGSASLLGICLFLKFLKDNLRLAREVGIPLFLATSLKTFAVFVPILFLLVPGIYLGTYVTTWTNRGIGWLQIQSAPDIISEKLEKKIERNVEERVKRNLPWWYAPAVWVGAVEDYATQVVSEVETAVETVNKAKPKPWHIQALAGAGKSALFAIGIYSMTWVIILVARAYASLFGRILVTSHSRIVLPTGTSPRSGADPEPSASHCLACEIGEDLTVEMNQGDALFVRGRDLPENATPNLHWRWASGGRLMRIRKGLFAVNQITGKEENSRVRFRGTGGARYMSVDLPDGEEAVVNPALLVGFSKGVRFRVRWNFNMPLMALQRVTFFVARGQGRLVFKSPGVPVVYDDPSSALSVDFENVMIFNPGVLLLIEGSKGAHNEILSPCVVRLESGGYIVSVPAVKGRMSGLRRIWALIKATYLPI